MSGASRVVNLLLNILPQLEQKSTRHNAFLSFITFLCSCLFFLTQLVHNVAAV